MHLLLGSSLPNILIDVGLGFTAFLRRLRRRAFRIFGSRSLEKAGNAASSGRRAAVRCRRQRRRSHQHGGPAVARLGPERRVRRRRPQYAWSATFPISSTRLQGWRRQLRRRPRGRRQDARGQQEAGQPPRRRRTQNSDPGRGNSHSAVRGPHRRPHAAGQSPRLRRLPRGEHATLLRREPAVLAC